MQDQESGIAIMPLTLPFTESGDCLVMVDMTGYCRDTVYFLRKGMTVCEFVSDCVQLPCLWISVLICFE